MRFEKKRLALIVLVVCFIAIGRENTDRDVAIAQGRRAVTISRTSQGPMAVARRRHRTGPQRAWHDGHAEGHWSGVQRAATHPWGKPPQHCSH